MNILLVMVPLSIVLLIGAGFAFFWAVEHDQFDDMDTPALLPLIDVPFDDDASSDAFERVQPADALPQGQDVGGNFGDRESGQ